MDANWVEAIGTVASAFAALISIGVAAYAVYAQRLQSQRSVKPLPFIVLEDYVACISVILRNVGVGPMVIKKLTVVDACTGRQLENVIDFMPILPDYLAWETFIGSELVGRPIAANGEIILLRFAAAPGMNPEISALYSRIRNTLAGLSMRVVVEDVYKNETVCERKFTWFGRTFMGYKFNQP